MTVTTSNAWFQTAPAYNGRLETLCDKRSVEAAGALHMDALHVLVYLLASLH